MHFLKRVKQAICPHDDLQFREMDVGQVSRQWPGGRYGRVKGMVSVECPRCGWRRVGEVYIPSPEAYGGRQGSTPYPWPPVRA